MDNVILSNWILLFIIWLLILPYFTYTLFIYIKYKRYQVYFQKRKPLLVDIVIGLVFSGIFLENQSLIFLAIYDLDGNMFAAFLRFFNISSMIAIYMIIMIRIYLLYFQSQYNEATISQKWKEFVNEEHEDFFLSNIHSFGDDKFLIKLSSIIWVILCAIYITVEIFTESTAIASWFIFAIFICLFFFAFTIKRKFPDFHDTLYIRKELEYFVVLNFLVICIWTILLALSSEVTSALIRHYSQVIMYWIIFWISINRVIAWNEVHRVSVTDKKDTNWRRMMSSKFGLKQVVESQKGYEQFMKFLVTEFATENLLFVTEYIQLKSLLALSDKEMKSLKLQYWLSLPENLPIPKIIQDLNLDLEQIKATQRYRKEKQLKRDRQMQQSLDFQNNGELAIGVHKKPNHIYAKSDCTHSVAAMSPHSTSASAIFGATNSPSSVKTPNSRFSAKKAYDSSNAKPDKIEANLEIAVTDNIHNTQQETSEVSIGVEDILEPVNTYSVTKKALSDDEDFRFNIFSSSNEMDADDDNTLKHRSNISSTTPKTVQPKLDFGSQQMIMMDANNPSLEKVASPTLDTAQTPTIVRQSFIEEMEKHKEVTMITMKELLSVPSVSADDATTDANHAIVTESDRKYSKDDMAMHEKAKGEKDEHRRHQSLSLRNIINIKNNEKSEKRADGEKEVKLSQRVRNHSAMLSHSIRSKSSKLKTQFSYHMREASQSMALKYNLNMKKNEKFNVLDCKSFSILCTKLYYKYIAAGVAPLEVNISSATRVRCTHVFQKKRERKAPQSLNTKRMSKTLEPETRARAISRGVVSLLSKKTHLVSRNDALDILKGYNDGNIARSKSRKKMSMGNIDEPFNGDIVIAMSQLLPPLEQCAVEIDNLLKDSLHRFKKTRNCCKIWNEFQERKKMEEILKRSDSYHA